MTSEREAASPATSAGAQFTTTHWSVVLAAGDESPPEASGALESLCRTYWYPLYAYVRRRGYAPPDAQDLTQAFFARLFERKVLAGLKPGGGRFRSFLLTALKNFLINEWERAQTRKRGGGAIVFSFDGLDPEERYALEPVDHCTPDRLFDRRWAETVLSQALTVLQEEQCRAEKQALFDALLPYLTGAERSQPYVELAARLDLSEAAVKMTVHRLRRRYGELLRAEIAHTVASPGDIDGELRALVAAAAS